MLVMKFGGTSVGNADCLLNAARLVQEAQKTRGEVVVVVSAMSGVTDALIKAARTAAAGDDQGYRSIKAELLKKHLDVVAQLVEDRSLRLEVSALIEERLHHVERVCYSVAVLGELTLRGLDKIASAGEQLSAPILAAVLQTQGCPARAVDATELVVTDENFGAANPLMELTRDRVQAVIVPLVQRGFVPVVTGFVGATERGITTTLGRGGSDYSAGILGGCLDASEVQIWTDVDGILTADPKIVPEARTLSELSYVEAAELAYFGAKVLHPKTILPTVERNVPVRVLNSFNPSCPGTLIIGQPRASSKGVKAISAIKGVSLITVEGRGMLGVPGIAARTFAATARVGSNVLMISQSSSEQSICFVVPRETAAAVTNRLEAELEKELARRDIDRVSGQDEVAILAVVGAGLRNTPGVAAQIFGALGGNEINIIAIAQGSSEFCISLVIDRQHADQAVQHIHRELGLSNGQPSGG